MTTEPNVNPAEVGHFDRLASRWWDPDGELRTLHDLNPLRTGLITNWTSPHGKRVLDIGCGGGLLTEALARAGGRLTGIDLSTSAIEVANLHRYESGLEDIRYLVCDAAALAGREAGTFDVVCCLELLEHVPDPAALVAAAATLVRPGGSVVISSLNRSLRSWITAIVGAEYLAGIIPRGTHRFEQLIRPGELDRWARAAGLQLAEILGIDYDPATRTAWTIATPSVNYIAHFRRGNSG